MNALNDLLAADDIDLSWHMGPLQWIGFAIAFVALIAIYLVLRSWWRYVRDLHADLDELSDSHNDLLTWLDEHLNGAEDNRTPTGRHAHGATRMGAVTRLDIDGRKGKA